MAFGVSAPAPARDASAALGRQLAAMLRMQETLNAQVHPDWRRQRFPWTRAIWVECAELLGHLGYKWWRRDAVPASSAQLKLELVDIWHFGVSAELERADAEHVAPGLGARIESILERTPAPEPWRGDRRAAAALIDAVESLARQALSRGGFPLVAFFAAAHAAGCGFDELFTWYVAKHALNRLRQERGDAAGGYRRRWRGREDNEHLAEIVSALGAAARTGDPHSLAELIHTALEARYERSAPVHP